MCGQDSEKAERWLKGLGEMVVGQGITNPLDSRPAVIVSIYVSHTGAWTIMGRAPDGRFCLLSSGEHWEVITPIKGPVL